MKQMGWRSCISTVRTCQKVFASIKDQIDNMHVLSYVLLTQTRLGSIVLWNSNPLEGQGATSCAQGLQHPQTEYLMHVCRSLIIDRSGHVLGCWRKDRKCTRL